LGVLQHPQAPTCLWPCKRSRQGRTDMNEHIPRTLQISGAAEQVQQTCDHWTNVCCMVPEKPADVISEVVNSEKFQHFTRIIDCFATSA